MTNTLKHAGPAVRATVHLRYLAHEVQVDVIDNGHVAGVSGTDSMNGDSGHGLTGMRERTAVYGGSLQAGPVDGSGWRIRARLPVATSP